MNVKKGRNKFNKHAVSEILGTVLLLAMSIAIFTSVYFFVIDQSTSSKDRTPPSSSIAGLTSENKYIILEHRGGEDVTLESKIVLLIGGKSYTYIVADLLDFESKKDGTWNMGEKLVFSAVDITDLQVEVTITDSLSNSVIMGGILQEGELLEIPYVITMDATNIESREARLWMKYNFRNETGVVRFIYKSEGGSWTNTSWVSLSGNGTYGELITNLTPKITYLFRAQLRYDITELEGTEKSFSTWSIKVGVWHFDEGSGGVAFDSSGRENHGTIFGAQWSTGVNDSALYLDGIDDYIDVPDSESLDISEQISIESWLKPQNNTGLFSGEINGVVGISEFGSLYSYEPDMVNVSGNIYAICYRGTGNDGLLTTVEIGNSGKISQSEIDTFEFDETNCFEPKIIHIDGSIYAITYRGDGDDGFLITIQINGSGKITKTVIDNFEFDTNYGRGPNIIKVYGNIFAVAYTGPGYDGYLKTVKISDAGIIEKSVIDTLIFDSEMIGVAEDFDLIKIDNNIFGIAYTNPDSDGFLKTVEIANDGQIKDSVIDSYAFDIFDGFEPSIAHVSGDIYAIAYGGFSSIGIITTIEIQSNGIITKSQIDTELFDSSYGREPKLSHIDGNTFAIIYRGPDNDGFTKTMTILSNGLIIPVCIDTYEFEVSDCYLPKVVKIDGSIYSIVYTGPNSDGFLKTVEIANNGKISYYDIDHAEFGMYECREPDVIHIDGEIYAIVFRGLYNDGYLRTITISDTGEINDTIIDTFEFETDSCFEPKIIHVGGDIFAIVYSGPGDDGYVKTVEIDDYGNITGNVIDYLEFDTSYCVHPEIVHVFSSIYAIAYTGPGNDGFVTTVEINADGSISDTIIKSFEFETSYCITPYMLHINSDFYAIAHRGPSDDGFLKTIEIATDGQISDILFATAETTSKLEFDTSKCTFPKIIHIENDVYAICYSGDSEDGWIKTVRISGGGLISTSIIDSYEFETSYAYPSDIVNVDTDIYAIVYRGPGYDGYIKTIRIGPAGDIIDWVDDALEFETSDTYEPDMIQINGTIFAVAYGKDSVYDGYVKTIKITPKETPGWAIAKEGSYKIELNSTMVFGSINSNTLYANISSGFNHIVLTYDKDATDKQMKLYIDSKEVANKTLTDLITINSNDLIFGRFNCIIDEITIYDIALPQSTINDNYNKFKP
ncbi:MAG: type IV pilin [Candidatus Thermoplasmatota archaeon]|nr:type IV pilin [Candidatus Thermoplasmatota archaeon]